MSSLSTMEGSHLTAEEGVDLGVDLLVKMLVGIEDESDRFDQSLACIETILM